VIVFDGKCDGPTSAPAKQGSSAIPWLVANFRPGSATFNLAIGRNVRRTKRLHQQGHPGALLAWF